MSDDLELQRRALARVGSVLRGKYRLDGVLGVGGMAVVYAATHRNQAEFAIKVLHPELSLSTDLRTRFLREGYAANSVKHPGAVLVVDDDVAEDGSAFLVMERLHGGSVEDLLEAHGGRIPSRLAMLVVLRLLDVLVAAHEKGIVHRDIKPANVFVTRDGQVKVLDFGIARARDALQSNGAGTGTGVVLGTPAYMAPEQAMARGNEIDERTDVWATGATLYAMLTGEIVHVGENAHQLLVHAATQPARPIQAVAARTEDVLALIVDKALQFRREDRFQTAAMMRDAIGSRAMGFTGGLASTEELASFAQGDVDRGGLSNSRTLPAWDPKATPRLSGPVPMLAESDPIALAASGSRPSFAAGIPGMAGLGGHGTQSSLSTLIEPPAPRPTADRRRRAVLIALVAGPMLLGAGVALMMTLRLRPAVTAIDAPPIDLSSSSSSGSSGSAMADSAPASPGGPSPPTLVVDPAGAMKDAGDLELAVAPPAPSSVPPVKGAVKGPGSGGAKVGRPPVTRHKVDCSVPYEWVDGIRRFKEQCVPDK